MEQLISTRQAAQLLGLSPDTLRRWRTSGRGPAYARFGALHGRAFYLPKDIEAWVDRHLKQSSQEMGRA